MKKISLLLILLFNTLYSQIQLEKIIAVTDTSNPMEKQIVPYDIVIDTINNIFFISGICYFNFPNGTVLIYNQNFNLINKFIDTTYSVCSYNSIVFFKDTFYLYIKNVNLEKNEILEFINKQVARRITLPTVSSYSAISKFNNELFFIEQEEPISKLIFLSRNNFQITRSYSLNRLVGRMYTLLVRGNYLYYSGNSSWDFYTHARKINLENGEIIWTIETPEDTFKSFSNYSVLDNENNLYVAGTKSNPYALRFYLYKIDNLGNILWYKDFYPSDTPFVRQHWGNFLNTIETFENYVIIGGEVEEYPRNHPRYDPNRRSAYLAIFDKNNGNLIKEIFFNRFNYPTYSIDGVKNIKYKNGKLYVLINACLFKNFIIGYENYIYVYNVISSSSNENDKQINNFNFSLYQNYPNPFNPSTVISVTLPENSTMSLKIYNSLGQEIKTLVDGSFIAGIHNFTWDGTDNS
ncbi:MAG: hypothetical protein N2485_08355, partial [bacterium]|nr:hypothetical protein [bacterium]